MELLFQTDNTDQFLSNLLMYVQSKIYSKMKQVRDEDSIYIGCENFYAYVLTKDIPSLECIEKELDVTLNFDIDIEIYQKKQSKGIADVRMLIEWFLRTFSGDMVLFSDTSNLIALRQRGNLICKEM